MSLSAVASYSADKGSSLFEQGCDDFGADFFDQFLTSDPIDHESSDYPALPDSTRLAKAARENNIGTSASNLLGGKPDLSHHSHHTSAPGSHFYTELFGQAAISDSELLNLENISLGSPISPLTPTIRANSLPRISTPPPTAATIPRTRARITESFSRVSKKAHSSDKSLRSPVRKSGNSPRMVRCSEKLQNNLDVWGNIFNSKFRFDYEHPAMPSTPPQTARVSDGSESSSVGFMKDGHDDVFNFGNSLPQQLNGRHAEYDTPLATPVLDGQHSRKTSSQQTFSDGMEFPATPQFHQSSGSWSQIAGSSELNYGIPAVHTPDMDAPVWWNHAATAPMAQPSPTALHINPRRATKSLAHQLQNDVCCDSNGLSSSKMPSGLMIQMPGTPGQQSFVVTSPHMQSPHMSQHGYFAQPQAHTSHHQYPLPPHPYVPMAGAHPQHSPNMRKTRSSTRHHTEPTSPKTASSNFHIRKRKTTKGSKEKKSPSLGGADFVNFTPYDSRKILTGVAPSGSSKTRARREKEANEKRRKLSMAALRAVREAGGDVDSLVEQGLFA